MNEKFDVIIIGSGPAGLTAAIYCTRSGLKTLVIAGFKWGGQLQLTTEVENFPGFPEGIQGPELMLNMRKQAERFGAIFKDVNMDPVDFSTQSGGPFNITAGGENFQGKALLIATGADAKTLGIPGEERLTGRGISYCATCDGAFFKNKYIIVAGGGDSAMEEALFLTNFASQVVVLHRRDVFKASAAMLERAKKNPKISFVTNSQITEVVGENKVQAVKIKTVIPSDSQGVEKSNSQNNTNEADLSASVEMTNRAVGMTKEQIEKMNGIISQQSEKEILWEMPVDGIFVAIGHTPNTNVFKGLELNERGYVSPQDGTRTNINGVFVSGDVEDDRYRQAITAAGFGCMAALDIEKWLREKN